MKQRCGENKGIGIIYKLVEGELYIVRFTFLKPAKFDDFVCEPLYMLAHMPF